MSKVTQHDFGMVSVDASDVEADRVSIEFLKSSRLYQSIVGTMGKDRAQRIIDAGAVADRTPEPVSPVR